MKWNSELGHNSLADLISDKGGSFGADSTEPSYFTHWDLVTNCTEEKGYQYGYEAESDAPILWHPGKQGYISWSVKGKTQWAKRQALAGVFTWKLSGG